MAAVTPYLTASNIATGLAAVSTVTSVLGQQSAAKSESANLKYQAAQGHADAAAERGAAQVQAMKIRRQGRAQQSQATAALAASGVDVNVGTANTINTQIMKNTEEDALTAILNGDNSARRREAAAQGNLIEAENVRSAANINSFSSVLAGGYQIANGWKTSSKASKPRLTDSNPFSYSNYA